MSYTYNMRKFYHYHQIGDVPLNVLFFINMYICRFICRFKTSLRSLLIEEKLELAENLLDVNNAVLPVSHNCQHN